ncbi:MAG: hypothetical protein M3418_08985 [Gemmatimonadota bacterium]|jgi:hypothetical protein|nr:hypothetical protein [Gemmatimonadota bacterium]
MQKKAFVLAALLPFAAACSDSTGPEAGQVAVRFRAVTATGASASLGSTSGVSFDHVPVTGAITLTGSNGTLVLQDIRVIVSELELKRAEGACMGEGEDDDCEKFEGGPFLVNLLDGSATQSVSALIPAGSYTEFEFEVEDLDADEDDSAAERQAIGSIFTQVRQAYPAFPSNASMVVHGTFTPTGGTAQPFTVYFDAEIEVEHKFATAFRVPEDGAITVNLDPALWFRTGTQVMNLAAVNGKTLEFEAEFKNGIASIEHDD